MICSGANCKCDDCQIAVEAEAARAVRDERYSLFDRLADEDDARRLREGEPV